MVVVTPTASGFLGSIDFSSATMVILSVGAGLLALGAIALAVFIGYQMLFGKVYVKDHGFYDRDVYDSAMRDLHEHWRVGGIMDKESREALSHYQLSHRDELEWGKRR